MPKRELRLLFIAVSLLVTLAIGMTGASLAAKKRVTSKKPIKPASSIIWQQRQPGNIQITWTPTNLHITDHENKPWDYRSTVVNQLENDFRSADTYECASHYTLEKTIQLVSAVGPWLSLDESVYSYMTPSAHPSEVRRYKTINAAEPDKQVNLAEIFPDEKILKAMLDNPLVQQALQNADEKIVTPPTNTQELMKRIANVAVKPPDHECEFMFERNNLTNFAFERLKLTPDGTSVITNLSLIYQYEPCRGQMYKTPITIPLNPGGTILFDLATNREVGFMQNSAETISKGRFTKVDLQKSLKPAASCAKE